MTLLAFAALATAFAQASTSAPHPAAPQDGQPDVDRRRGHEEFRLIGWNQACSAAVEHLRFPPPDRGAEPVWGRLGTLSLAPDQTQETAQWSVTAGAKGSSWDPALAPAVLEQLSRQGYRQAGFEEAVRPAPAGRLKKDLEKLRSTAGLQVRYPVTWPGTPYAMVRVHYSPLGSCALVLFEKPGGPPDAYRYQLVRTPVEARRHRAQAHLNGALLLYRSEDDIYGALEETEIAARMDPRLGQARYHYAALLAAHGRFDEAIRELTEAVKLDRRYAATSKQAPEFEDIRKQPRFLDAMAPPSGTMPLAPR